VCVRVCLDRGCTWVCAVQLGLEKIGSLTMHMLVLFASTGANMDLRAQGFIIDRMTDIFPTSVYTQCIEEHNIHAIFRWECVLDIYRDYQQEVASPRVVSLPSAYSSMVSARNRLSEPTGSSGNPRIFGFPDIVLPASLGEQKFLHNSGLTLSITTHGTCIYRVGTKRLKLDANTPIARAREAGDTYSGSGDDFVACEYTDETEQFIFDICKYIQFVLVL